MLLISLGSLSSGSDRGLLILHLVIYGLQPTCNLQADATAGAGLALHNRGTLQSPRRMLWAKEGLVPH